VAARINTSWLQVHGYLCW